MVEKWRPVAGWEGFYEVSDRGQVRGLPRIVGGRPGVQPRRRWAGRTLLQDTTPQGYRTVQLCRDGKPEKRMVDRLVLTAFTGPPPDGDQACHHGEPGDNWVEHLYWGKREKGTRTYRVRRDEEKGGTPVNADRTVHGQTAGGGEICRYDTAGTWYVENDPSLDRNPVRRRTRRRVTVKEAARLAANGGRTFLDLPGGRAFDAAVRELTEKHAARMTCTGFLLTPGQLATITLLNTPPEPVPPGWKVDVGGSDKDATTRCLCGCGQWATVYGMPGPPGCADGACPSCAMWLIGLHYPDPRWGEGALSLNVLREPTERLRP